MSFGDFLDGLVEAVAEKAEQGGRRVLGGMNATHRRGQGLPTTARNAPNTIYSKGPEEREPRDFRKDPARARRAPNTMVNAPGLSKAFDHEAFRALDGQQRGLVPLNGGADPMLGYWDGKQMHLVTDRGQLGKIANPVKHADSYLAPIDLPSWADRGQ